jgi:hypothetical protein
VYYVFLGLLLVFFLNIHFLVCVPFQLLPTMILSAILSVTLITFCVKFLNEPQKSCITVISIHFLSPLSALFVVVRCNCICFFPSPKFLVFSLTIVQFVFFSSTSSFAASFSIVRMIYLVTIFIPSDEMYSFYKVFRYQKVIQPLMNCS